MLVSRAEFLRRSAALAALALVPEVSSGCSAGGPPIARAKRFEIHPAIGIARVGNSADAFHFGPEVPGTLPMAPAYWPARVPDEVLTEADYQTVMDRTKPLAERRRAFAHRRSWIRAVADIRVPTSSSGDSSPSGRSSGSWSRSRGQATTDSRRR